MQQTVEKVFFALIRFEIDGTELGDIKNLITPEMLPALFKLSKKHDFAHLVGDALDKNGLLPDDLEVKKRFLQERNMAIYRYEQQQYEFEQICTILEDAKIPFIPLKGSVLRQYYPEPWMRTSCDIDILVKESELDKATEILKERLGYTANDKKDFHDISLFSISGVHIELHYSICENMKNIDKLLSRAWDNIESEDGYKKRFSDEYFLFHIIAHMLYHFQSGGCGVRPVLDLYILQRRFSSEEQLRRLLNQCGIITFYQAMLELAHCWFADIQLNERAACIQNYLLKAGVYGTQKNNELAATVKSGSKRKHVLRYIFLPYSNMVILYPILKKAKILLPFFHLWRWITRIFKVKSAAKRTQSIIGQGEEDLEAIRKLFVMLDI